MRAEPERQLRQRRARYAVRPLDHGRLGCPAVQLGVLRRYPAGSCTARVGVGRLLPPHQRQLLGHGQRGARRERLHAVRGDGADRRPPAEFGPAGERLLRSEQQPAGAQRRQGRRGLSASSSSTGTASTSPSTRGCGTACSCRAVSAPARRCSTTARSRRQVPETLSGLTGVLGAPAAGVLPISYCHQETGFIPQYKALASYMLPWYGIRVSGTLQSLPGPALLAQNIYNNTNRDDVDDARAGRSRWLRRTPTCCRLVITTAIGSTRSTCA